MNIVLFGPPAAGKGTQSEKLAKELNNFKISTGDLLRSEVKKNSSLGKKIKVLIDKGELVPDSIINSVVENLLADKKYFNKMIFDGYPRNLNQAKHLDVTIKKHKQKITCVFSLTVNLDTIIKRITGRQVCSNCKLTFNKFFNPSTLDNHKCDSKFLEKRVDDTEDTVKSRYDTYSKETAPIIEYYKNQKILYEINGMGDISMIYKEIHHIISSLHTWLYNMYLYK